MITAEIVANAVYYEGTVPDSWELIGMMENQKYRFRYYISPERRYYRTAQKLKRQWVPQIDIRQENGHTFASRNFRNGRYVV